MSRISNVALGIVAGALALGAAHLDRASSGTLPALPQGDASLRAPAHLVPAHDVNRTPKSARLVVPGAAAANAADQGSTMFVYPLHAPATLIAARINRKAPAKPVPAVRKAPRNETSTDMKVACEPLMSVLAAAADETSPGRCMV